MNSFPFRVEEWTYVPDPMGRIGQGYYQNNSNPQENMTIAEFEAKRKSAYSAKETEKEHNINNLPPPSPPQPNTLSPWNNPVYGEEKSTPTRIENTAKETQPDPKPKVSSPQIKSKGAEKVQKAQRQRQENLDDQEAGDFAESASGGAADAGRKVICTALVERQMMDPSRRRACLIYAQSRLPHSFMDGYHFWAIPYVHLMNRHDWAVQLIIPFVRHRTQEICYRLGLAPTGSFLGKLICTLHDPICCLLGKFYKAYRAPQDVL